MQPIVNMLEEDRAMDIGNMYKKFGKDCVRVSPEIHALSMGMKTPSQQYAMRPIVNVLKEVK